MEKEEKDECESLPSLTKERIIRIGTIRRVGPTAHRTQEEPEELYSRLAQVNVWILELSSFDSPILHLW